MVDCGQPYNGCHGGWEFEGLEYARQHGRIATSAAVPYTGRYTYGCSNGDMYRGKENAFETAGVKIEKVYGASYNEYTASDADDKLMTILSTRVASVGIYAGHAFMNYESGIFNDHNCQWWANHAVVAVGYGADSSNRLYRFQT